MFLLVTDIKNLSKVVMQWYNYPKLIWMKQNTSFACSIYQSNWQLIDNFCLHLSEPSCIETRRKRIVNRIMTTEPWCTVNLVNHFTSYVHPMKLKISTSAQANQSLMSIWRHIWSLASHRVTCKDSNRTVQVCRLIYLFAWYACKLVGNAVPWLNAIICLYLSISHSLLISWLLALTYAHHHWHQWSSHFYFPLVD